MIKIIMCFMAAAAMTLTSIGAVVANKKAPKLEDQYVLIEGCFVPYAVAMLNGHCADATPQSTCTYTIKDPGGSLCDPDNFDSNEDGDVYELDDAR